MAEPGSEEQGLMSPPAVETCPNLESLQLLEASPASSPSTPMDLPEPRGTTEHTNNRIGESACLGGSRGAQGQGEMGPEPPEGARDPEYRRPSKEEAGVPPLALMSRRRFL